MSKHAGGSGRVDLVALPDRTPGIIRLRQFLKQALRQHRLRATRVAEVTPPGPPGVACSGPEDAAGGGFPNAAPDDPATGR
jgi:hypothetical protein